jgi:von Willebrand factor A domain-containing protein 5
MATSARIFSFGLGHEVSHSLVKGLARATNGRFIFVPSNSSVDTHVGEQLQKALQPCITNIKIKWNLNHPVMSVPTQPPPVHVNDRFICHALSDSSTSTFDHNSHVELFADQQRIGKAKINQASHISNDGTIARLAAKALILELQHSKHPPENTTGSLQDRSQQEIQFTTELSIHEEDSIKKKANR